MPSLISLGKFKIFVKENFVLNKEKYTYVILSHLY